MDQRILLVALGVAALAFASLAFAGGQGWAAQGGQFEGWNATAKGGMMRMGAPEWAGNGTACQRGSRLACNGSCARALNGTGMPRFNETAHEEFEAAVEGGDFASAKKLHEEYGFGGLMFEKLNATTFAKFSQVHKLQSELATELGMENMPGMMGGEGMGMMQGGGAGRMRGMGGGRGMGMHLQME